MKPAKDVKAKIMRALPDLRSGHRNIARLLLEKPENAFLPANALAAEIGVSPASFVRFAKRVGFPGYLQLRKQLIKELRAEDSMTADTAKHLLSPADTILREEAEALSKMRGGYDHASLRAMTEVLARAGKAIVTGYGLPGKLAPILAHYLRMTGLEVEPIINSKYELFDGLSHLGKGDTLIIIDHGRYVKDLVHAVDVAEKWGVTVGVITDTEFSPLAQKANVCLFFDLIQHDHIFGHSQLIVLIEMLALKVYGLRKNETKQFMKKHEGAWEEGNFVWNHE
jgi:DNA-binding MurR/RpiR family transcriptional regulator